MNQKTKYIKWISVSVLLVLNVLAVAGIEFMVGGIHLVTIDIVLVVLYSFFRIAKRITKKSNVEIRLAILTIVSVFLSFSIYFVALMTGQTSEYQEVSEPISGQRFLVSLKYGLTKRGSAHIYERFGPFIIVDKKQFSEGEFYSFDAPKVIINDKKTEITILLPT